ncbi:MAG: HAD family hydrolase [Alphaproteobacteria bacterium]|nr:MAG: HAD family hydrolase [Alphaproteobacteria bacterium]
MNGRPAPRATVFVDADNTLWETDSVFAAAQLNLLEGVETLLNRKASAADRLAFVRSVDQRLAQKHHDGLRYPPRLLVRGIAIALDGMGAERAVKAAWLGSASSPLPEAREAEVERNFFGDIATLPEPRPGVLEGLDALQDAGCLVLVVTEAASRKTEEIAAKLGMADHFDRVVEGRKRPALYQRIVRLAGTPDRSFMVGDQLDRDIAPAKAAGLETIYYPGNFKPRWQLDEDAGAPDHRISSFAEVPGIVLAPSRVARVAGRR